MKRRTLPKGDLLDWNRQISAVFEIADDAVRGLTNSGRQKRDAQLTLQVIAQGHRRGQKGFERRLLNRFRGRTFKSGVEVIVEKTAEVDLVEGICLRFRRLRRNHGRGPVESCCIQGALDLARRFACEVE